MREPQNASVTMIGVLTGIRIGHIPNRSIAPVTVLGTSSFLCPSILIMLKVSSLSSGSSREIWNQRWRHAQCVFSKLSSEAHCVAKQWHFLHTHTHACTRTRTHTHIYIYISLWMCVCVCLIMWVRWQHRFGGASLMTAHTLCLVRNELWLLNMTNIPGDADNRRRMQHASHEVVADVHKLIPLPIPAGPVHDSLLALGTGCWESMTSLGSGILVSQLYTKPHQVQYLAPRYGVSLNYDWSKLRLRWGSLLL